MQVLSDKWILPSKGLYVFACEVKRTTGNRGFKYKYFKYLGDSYAWSANDFTKLHRIFLCSIAALTEK